VVTLIPGGPAARRIRPLYYSQLDTQAVSARGWLVAKIAVPATKVPITKASATILVMSPSATRGCRVALQTSMPFTAEVRGPAGGNAALTRSNYSYLVHTSP
jgi:hypothetical protein